MNNIAFLFCSDYFDKKQPDSDYAKEYIRAKELGLSVYLFCLEDFLESNKIKISPTDKPITLIYRGWMITCEQYNVLYDVLSDMRYTLINNPEQYRQCHHLPYWYDLLKNYTADSVWTQGIPSKLEIVQMLENFKSAPLIVKDYVKSRKHEWEDACFIPNSADFNHSVHVVNTFIDRQGDDLAGGIVLREYLPLKMLGSHEKSHMPIAKEIRVFCFWHKPFAYIQYWSGDEYHTRDEYQELIEKCRCLNSNFYTIDLAQLKNGDWIIIEVGDGQVSGLQGYRDALFYDEFLKVNSISKLSCVAQNITSSWV